MNRDELKPIVWGALERAVENGYAGFVRGFAPETVAVDLLDNDAEVEVTRADVRSVADLVAEWRMRGDGI